jgi:hypothetical protein
MKKAPISSRTQKSEYSRRKFICNSAALVAGIGLNAFGRPLESWRDNCHSSDAYNQAG